jgi:hypothetical protein
MPGRLDRVQVAVSRGAVTIPWDSRDALLAQLQEVPELQSIVTAFRAVGASRPVELTQAEKANLLTVLDAWSGRGERLPAGIYEPAERTARRPARRAGQSVTG